MARNVKISTIGYGEFPEFIIVRPNGNIVEATDLLDLLGKWKPGSSVYTRVTDKDQIQRGHSYIQFNSNANHENRHYNILITSTAIQLDSHDPEKYWYAYMWTDNDDLPGFGSVGDVISSNKRKTENGLYKQVGERMKPEDLVERIKRMKERHSGWKRIWYSVITKIE